MATATPYVTERRHLPDRRASGSGSAAVAHRLNAIDWIAMVLMFIGGINWGLVGLFGFNLVDTLFGEMSPLSRVIYVVVGLASLYWIYSGSKMARRHG